jgi:hypothetical protein
MAIDYSYDPQAGLIRIVGHGEVTLEDRVHFIRRLLNDPELPALASILVQVNEVTNAPDAEDVQGIGKLIERLLARFYGRVAIVNVTVGHLTMSHLVALSVNGGHNRVRVFASEAQARDWLVF